MIHYHGTPITPLEQLTRMLASGRHVCIPFPRPDALRPALRSAQSILFDNGAFSTFTRGEKFDEPGYYRFLDPVLVAPHWAVVPDVIGGSEEQQMEMVSRWPYGRDLGAPVWHLSLSIDYLLRLVDEWPRVCLGSSAQYWQVGSETWRRRMDEAFDAIFRRHKRKWIHGLRMLGQADGPWPLASADSTNVAQSWKRDTGCAECKCKQIDSVNPPWFWRESDPQMRLL